MNQDEKTQNEQAGAIPAASQQQVAGFNFENLELSVQQMLKAGLHFGHKKSRWNPKMEPFIFGIRNNIHIIDLEKSIEHFRKALEFIEGTVKNGGKILFIGTKPQAKRLLKEIAESVGMPYVDNRWMGGTFTNYQEIKKRIKYLNEQEAKLARGELEKYTKYEQSQFKKEISRMNEKMGGMKKMESIPQAVFIIDAKENEIAVREAREIKVPVIGIVDTNVDPDLMEYPIPANDDALSSLKYILGIVAKTIAGSKKQMKLESEHKQKNIEN